MTTLTAPPPGLTTHPAVPLAVTLKAAAKLMGRDEARFLVDIYYQMQDFRIQSANQERAQKAATAADVTAVDEDDKSSPLTETTAWVFDHIRFTERAIKDALDGWVDVQRPGRWAKTITGIGPVLAAGLLAHIDIERCPTVGHIWRFAGLDPTDTWGKGEKRPWNARLKVLCWKVGESFVKVSSNPSDVYGKVYAARKGLEQSRNEAGQFNDQAVVSLTTKKFGKDTVARKWYEQGKLPPARIHLRAERYATKLFLAHLHHVMFEARYGVPPPKPYIFTQPGHTHYVAPPGWPCA